MEMSDIHRRSALCQSWIASGDSASPEATALQICIRTMDHRGHHCWPACPCAASTGKYCTVPWLRRNRGYEKEYGTDRTCCMLGCVLRINVCAGIIFVRSMYCVLGFGTKEEKG